MKVLITGANGQLGREVARQSQAFDFEVDAFDHQQLDISNEKRIQQALAQLCPSVVINAAAYTHVDRAEDEPDLAYAVNTDGPRYLAQYCAANHLALIHISTDYVFDGTKNQPYQENDPIAPLGIYGQSKARGEAAIRSVLPHHIIVRTSWLYGVYGHNFVKTILRLAFEKKTLKVVADQFGSPTSAAELAETILIITRQIAKPHTHLWGTYHYCGAGITSWHGLAEKIIELAAPYTKLRTCQVRAIATDAWPTAAPRPPYSALNCTRLKHQFGIDPLPWQQSLKETIERIFSGSQ